jgi:hypothetical protein
LAGDKNVKQERKISPFLDFETKNPLLLQLYLGCTVDFFSRTLKGNQVKESVQ